jgi:hypothetical protein
LIKAGELSGAAMKTYTVQGMLFYFPYFEGKESRPMSLSSFEDTYLTSRAAGGSSERDDDYSRATEILMEQDPTFSIYWQDRLVPESTVNRLPFFPTCTTRYDCSREDIPERWKFRIKGFLFFDWDFQVKSYR